MSVIEGASVSVKTMSDGTLRLAIDIEPRNAQAAFALFGSPGRAVALAALVDGAGAVREPAPGGRELAPAPGKGGEWAKLAGIWCGDMDFLNWINSTTHNGIHWHSRTGEDSAEFIREICEIDSRAQLDHSKEAWQRFDSRIRKPFQAWMQENGIYK